MTIVSSDRADEIFKNIPESFRKEERRKHVERKEQNDKRKAEALYEFDTLLKDDSLLEEIDKQIKYFDEVHAPSCYHSKKPHKPNIHDDLEKIVVWIEHRGTRLLPQELHYYNIDESAARVFAFGDFAVAYHVWPGSRSCEFYYKFQEIGRVWA